MLKMVEVWRSSASERMLLEGLLSNVEDLLVQDDLGGPESVRMLAMTSLTVIQRVDQEDFRVGRLNHYCGGRQLPVSYTHLTLPTICSV